MKKKLALVIVLVLILAVSFTLIIYSREQKALQEEVPESISNTEDMEPVKLAYVPEPTPETTPVITPEPTSEPTPEPIEWFEEVDEAVWTLNKTTPYSTFDEDAIEIKDEGEAIKKGVQLNRTGKGTKELEQWSRCVDADGNTVYILTIGLTTDKPVYTGGGTGNGGNGAGGSGGGNSNTTPQAPQPTQQSTAPPAETSPATNSSTKGQRGENSTAPVINDSSEYEKWAGQLH